MAIFRDEYVKAALFQQEAFPARSDPSEILELKGTLPIQEGWKQAFFAGTLELFLEVEEAVYFLERAVPVFELPLDCLYVGVKVYQDVVHRRRCTRGDVVYPLGNVVHVLPNFHKVVDGPPGMRPCRHDKVRRVPRVVRGGGKGFQVHRGSRF